MPEIENTTKNTSKKPFVSWNNITNGDTVNNFNWPGGKGFIQISGTLDSAVIQTEFDGEPLDLDTAP